MASAMLALPFPGCSAACSSRASARNTAACSWAVPFAPPPDSCPTIALKRSLLIPPPTLSPLSGIAPPLLRFVFEPELIPTGLLDQLETLVKTEGSRHGFGDEFIRVHAEWRPMKRADALKSEIGHPRCVRLTVDFHQLRQLRRHIGNRLLRGRLICGRTPGWPCHPCERRAQPQHVDERAIPCQQDRVKWIGRIQLH